MELKASLHIHTKEDIIDGYVVKYNIYELINYAQKHGFKVLALTGHKKFIYQPEFGEYAKSKGIILIPAIELHLARFLFFNNHIIILNCTKEAEQVADFEDLRQYKRRHPEIFIFTPHPGFGFLESISINKLIKNIDLFDGLEHSWFYSKAVNLNKKGEAVANKFHKPLIATSDAHILTYFNNDYTIIKAGKFNLQSVLEALRQGRIHNVTSPKSIFSLTRYAAGDILKRIINPAPLGRGKPHSRD